MKKIILFSILTLLIIGLGCSSNSANPLPKKRAITTSTADEVKMMPQQFSTSTSSYDFCKSKNYELIIRFDKTTQASKAFCRFPDKNECEANDFMRGICSPEKGAKPYIPEIAQTTANCTSTDAKVCGADGKTYVNHCSADLANIPVSHTGACGTVPVQSYGPTSTIKQPTTTPEQKTITPTTTPTPDWVKTVGDIIKSESKTKPPGFIKKCNLTGQTVYYQVDSCPNCFATLYKENGDVMCYPNNDFGNACNNFDAKNLKDCKTVWSDNR